MEELKDLRARIDSIDSRIMDLLQERFATVREVIVVKEGAGIPVRIPARIDEVIDRAERLAQDRGLPAGLGRALYEHIVEATCRFEETRLGEDTPANRRFAVASRA